MNEETVTQRIVDTLGNSGNINDLLLEICETTGMNWADAEALVARVREEKANSVAKRQFPLLAVIALGIFVGGLAVTGYGIAGLVSILSYIQAAIQSSGQSDIAAVQQMLVTFNVIITTGTTPFSLILFGATMLLGSLVGMKNAWRSIVDSFLETFHAR